MQDGSICSIINMFMKFYFSELIRLPMKSKKRKYHHKDYDFSRLSNCFSNPDLVEDYEPVYKPKKVNNPNVFQPPYANADKEVEINSDHSTDSQPSDMETCSSLSIKLSLRKTFSASCKKPPRGKCQNWRNCLQCSRTVNCGTCRNCLDKSLRYVHWRQ